MNSLIGEQFPDVVSGVGLTLEKDVRSRAKVLEGGLGVKVLDVLVGHLADGRVGAFLNDVAEVGPERRDRVRVTSDLLNRVWKKKCFALTGFYFLYDTIAYHC